MEKPDLRALICHQRDEVYGGSLKAFSRIRDLTYMQRIYLQIPFAASFTVRGNTISHRGPNFAFALMSIFIVICISLNFATVPLDLCRN